MSRVKAGDFHRKIALPTGATVTRLKCPQCGFIRDGFKLDYQIKSCEHCGLFMQLVNPVIICWSVGERFKERPDYPNLRDWA